MFQISNMFFGNGGTHGRFWISHHVFYFIEIVIFFQGGHHIGSILDEMTIFHFLQGLQQLISFWF